MDVRENAFLSVDELAPQLTGHCPGCSLFHAKSADIDAMTLTELSGGRNEWQRWEKNLAFVLSKYRCGCKKDALLKSMQNKNIAKSKV